MSGNGNWWTVLNSRLLAFNVGEAIKSGSVSVFVWVGVGGNCCGRMGIAVCLYIWLCKSI